MNELNCLNSLTESSKTLPDLKGLSPALLLGMDLERDREELGQMVSQMLPVERLVPIFTANGVRW